MKYKKKPLQIEAMQFTEKDFEKIEKWSGGKVFQMMKGFANNPTKCIIRTMTGNSYVIEGDMIIKEESGEIYSVPKSTFDLNYEKVETKKKPSEKKPNKSKS